MPEEFEGDLADAVFWGADLSRARFRDVDLTGATITHAWFVDVTVDALVDRVVINGVDVTDYVNERDEWYPLRAMLRPEAPDEMVATWRALSTEWDATIAQVRAAGEELAHRSVDGEFSFVQTIRHLVMAMDKWITAPVLGGSFDAIGLPNTGSLEFPWPGIDPTAAPTLDEALGVREERGSRFAQLLDGSSPNDLERTVDVLENGPHRVRDCIFTIFEEEFWHLRYARRDLATLIG